MKDVNGHVIYKVDVDLTVNDLIMKIYDESGMNHNDELESQLNMIEICIVVDELFFNAIEEVYTGNKDLMAVQETLYKNNDFPITLKIKNSKYTFRYETLVDALSQEIINRASSEQKLQYYKNIIFPNNKDINYVFLSIFLQKRIEEIDVFHIKISEELNSRYEIEQLIENVALCPYTKENFFGLLKPMKNMNQNINRYKRMINAHMFYQLYYQGGNTFLDDVAQEYIFKDNDEPRGDNNSNRKAIRGSLEEINLLENYNSIIMKILLLKYLNNVPLDIYEELYMESSYIHEDELQYKWIFDMITMNYIQQAVMGFSKEEIRSFVFKIEEVDTIRKRQKYSFPKEKGSLSLVFK